MLLLETGSTVLRDLFTRRFERQEKQSKAEVVMYTFCDYDGIHYNLTNPDAADAKDRSKVILQVALAGYDVLLDRKDCDVKAHLAKFSYAPFIQSSPNAPYNIELLLDFESDAIKGLANPKALIDEISDIKYHVFAAYLLPCFQQILQENPKPPTPQLIKIRSDEAIYVRPLADQVEITYRTKFDDDDDFEIGKVFIQEFSESRVSGPGVRAFVGKPPAEVASVFADYDKQRAAYVVISLRQQVIATEAKQLNAIKLCLSFRNYLHYHLKCSKAYIHSRMRSQTTHFLKVLNRALPSDEKAEKKTMGGRSFVPQH